MVSGLIPGNNAPGNVARTFLNGNLTQGVDRMRISRHGEKELTMNNTLSKRQESLLRAMTTRHGRRNSEFCLIEGLRCMKELVHLCPERMELCVLREDVSFPEAPEDRSVVLSEREFDRIAPTVHSQGILALALPPPYIPLNCPRKDSYSLVLDRVADPGNFGTIIRTARAVGLKEIWMVKGGVDPFGDKTIRSASSAQFALDLRMADSPEELVTALKALGVKRFFRTEPAGGHSVFTQPELFSDSAIVLGNEANGAAPIEGSLPLNIPMPGSAESLNVAQAATVILFESVRRMEQSGGSLR